MVLVYQYLQVDLRPMLLGKKEIMACHYWELFRERRLALQKQGQSRRKGPTQGRK